MTSIVRPRAKTRAYARARLFSDRASGFRSPIVFVHIHHLFVLSITPNSHTVYPYTLMRTPGSRPYLRTPVRTRAKTSARVHVHLLPCARNFAHPYLVVHVTPCFLCVRRIVSDGFLRPEGGRRSSNYEAGTEFDFRFDTDHVRGILHCLHGTSAFLSLLRASATLSARVFS